jgi:hypothetical protein
VELLRESPERAVLKFQNSVLHALNPPYARSALKECIALGATKPIVEKSLCCMLARLELIPRRIEIMVGARSDNKRAREYVIWIGEVLRLADTNADQTTAVLGIVDPTRPPAEIWPAYDIFIDHFASAPEAEQLLRAGLGLSSQRIHDYKMTARRSAFGYFAFLLHKQFKDSAPHDTLVANLLDATFSYNVSAADIQHYRDAYAKRQASISGPPISEQK